MMLQVADLDLFYGDAQALDDVALEVAEGEIVAIVGANGAGKTSLIRTIAGMQRPSRGSIRFEAAEIAGEKSHRICDLGIGQVAEGRQIFPNMSVLENLEMGAVVKRARAFRRTSLDRAFALFPRLAERRRQAAGTLSGGEQQMLAIARCLMMRPKLIVLDEPTEGIMPLLVSQIRREIHRINQSGVSILLVEQNVETALKLCPRVFLMEKGVVVYSGTSRELQTKTDIVHRYLGLSRKPAA